MRLLHQQQRKSGSPPLRELAVAPDASGWSDGSMRGWDLELEPAPARARDLLAPWGRRKLSLIWKAGSATPQSRYCLAFVPNDCPRMDRPCLLFGGHRSGDHHAAGRASLTPRSG